MNVLAIYLQKMPCDFHDFQFSNHCLISEWLKTEANFFCFRIKLFRLVTATQDNFFSISQSTVQPLGQETPLCSSTPETNRAPRLSFPLPKRQCVDVCSSQSSIVNTGEDDFESELEVTCNGPTVTLLACGESC